MPRLENWSLYEIPGSSYQAPEQKRFGLQGNIHEDDRFDEGLFVHTSPIVSVDGKNVQTRNTLYALGTVCPSYLAWYKENGPGQCDLESDTPLDKLLPSEE